MRRTLAGDMLHGFVAQCGEIDTCVESCAGTAKLLTRSFDIVP